MYYYYYYINVLTICFFRFPEEHDFCGMPVDVYRKIVSQNQVTSRIGSKKLISFSVLHIKG